MRRFVPVVGFLLCCASSAYADNATVESGGVYPVIRIEASASDDVKAIKKFAKLAKKRTHCSVTGGGSVTPKIVSMRLDINQATVCNTGECPGGARFCPQVCVSGVTASGTATVACTSNVLHSTLTESVERTRLGGMVSAQAKLDSEGDPIVRQKKGSAASIESNPFSEDRMRNLFDFLDILGGLPNPFGKDPTQGTKFRMAFKNELQKSPAIQRTFVRFRVNHVTRGENNKSIYKINSATTIASAQKIGSGVKAHIDWFAEALQPQIEAGLPGRGDQLADQIKAILYNHFAKDPDAGKAAGIFFGTGIMQLLQQEWGVGI